MSDRRAEPPTDGDRQISLKAAIEALQSQLDAMPQSVTTDTKGHLKREMDFEQGARGCLMHNIELLKSLGAAEPPRDGDLISRKAALDILRNTHEFYQSETAISTVPIQHAISLLESLAAEPPSAPAPASDMRQP